MINEYTSTIKDLQKKLKESMESKEYLTTIKQKTVEFENEVRVIAQRLKASEEDIESKNKLINDQNAAIDQFTEELVKL